MLELCVIQSRYRSHQCTRGSLDIRVTGIGADRLAAHLIIVELYLEGFLHITDRASRPDVEVVGTRLHHCKIVRRKKLLHCLRFLRRWREAGSDVVRFQPMMVAGGTAIIERMGERVELAAVVQL